MADGDALGQLSASLSKLEVRLDGLRVFLEAKLADATAEFDTDTAKLTAHEASITIKTDAVEEDLVRLVRRAQERAAGQLGVWLPNLQLLAVVFGLLLLAVLWSSRRMWIVSRNRWHRLPTSYV
jgi:hypothetical protein